MRTLDMQYQVCNSKTVDFGFHRQTDSEKAPRYETPHCADAWLALTGLY